MRVHLIEHMDLLGRGSIQEWLVKTGQLVTSTQLHKGELLPDPSEFDLVILLGGVMSVYEENKYSWLKTEKKWLKSVIYSGKHVLGICLGAQLIASALGADVRRHTYSEAGWWPVAFHPHARKHPFLRDAVIPEAFFQFHQDTFALPDKAVLLAGSMACTRQMFSLNNRVLGLQFHPEFTPESVQYIAKHLHSSLKEGPFIQSPDVMLSSQQNCEASKQFLFSMLRNIEASVQNEALSLSS